MAANKNKKKPTKKTNRKHWLSTKRLLSISAVLCIAVVGGLLLAASYATKDITLSSDPSTVIVEIRNEKPVAFISGQQPPQPIVLRLYGDGSVLCGQIDGSISYTQVATGEKYSIVNRLLDTGIVKVNNIASIDNSSAVSDYESVYINYNDLTLTKYYYNGEKPAAYDKVANLVGAVCASANKEVPANFLFDLAPAGSMTDEATQVDGFLGIIRDAFNQRALAAAIYSNGRDIFDEINNVASYRRTNSKSGLRYTACLYTVAQNHTKNMATKNSLYHNPSLASEVNSRCGGSWSVIAENVGYATGINFKGFDSAEASIFNAFKASTGHNANMLNSSVTHYGFGAMRSSGSNRLFITQVYAACSSCTTGWSTSYPTVGLTLTPISAAAGSNVNRGQVLQMRITYANGNSNAATTDQTRVQAVIPKYTTLYSQPTAYNPYKTGQGKYLYNGYHDPEGLNMVYYNFSTIPKAGTSYSSWSTDYYFKVNNDAPIGQKLCIHGDIWAPNMPLTIHGRSEVCYTVR